MCADRVDGSGQAADRLVGRPDESLFRAHFENLPGPAYIWRRTGDDFQLIDYNKAAAERIRSLAPELGGRPTVAALEGNQKEFIERLRRAVTSGKVERLEVDYRYRSGAVRRIVATLVPIAPDHVVQHTEDITDRHRAEEALRASDARSRALMAAHPDMLVRVTRDGVYLDAHIPAKVARELPLRAEQFVGKRVEELFDAEFARMHALHRERALETGTMQTWEYTRTVDGQRRYIEARFVKSGEDEVLITVTDVTNRVDLEREIVNSVERERNHIGRDLHDGLGQLLTGVKLMLEPLRKKLPPDGSGDAENLRQSIDLINQAIAQTSELARGLSPVPRDGGMTLCNALEQLARRSEALFGVACRVAADADADRLSGEMANNLYRIAQEAITNAVKHGRATEIALSCGSSEDALTLTIEDNGLGFRGAGAADGMGMHIMRSRARALGGDLSVSCRPGGGTVVTCVCRRGGPPPSAM